MKKLTVNKIETALLGTLGLKLEQEIEGKELWNHIVDGGHYNDLTRFIAGKLEEALFSDNEITDQLFGIDITKIVEDKKEKLLRLYKITTCNIEKKYGAYTFSVLGVYKKGNKWTKSNTQLFEIYVNE